MLKAAKKSTIFLMKEIHMIKTIKVKVTTFNNYSLNVVLCYEHCDKGIKKNNSA